jgi:DNA gyrase/topoisomerase IV subunit B
MPKSTTAKQGLGEMDAHELWKTTITRASGLSYSGLSDAALADETYSILMGEVSPESSSSTSTRKCDKSDFYFLAFGHTFY